MSYKKFAYSNNRGASRTNLEAKNVLLKGNLSMSCNEILNVKNISFCNGTNYLDTLQAIKSKLETVDSVNSLYFDTNSTETKNPTFNKLSLSPPTLTDDVSFNTTDFTANIPKPVSTPPTPGVSSDINGIQFATQSGIITNRFIPNTLWRISIWLDTNVVYSDTMEVFWELYYNDDAATYNPILISTSSRVSISNNVGIPQNYIIGNNVSFTYLPSDNISLLVRLMCVSSTETGILTAYGLVESPNLLFITILGPTNFDTSGNLNMSCNQINDVSEINLCDGTYIGEGDSVWYSNKTNNGDIDYVSTNDISSSKYNGGVLANNGKIYGIPNTSNNVLIIDSSTRPVSFDNTTISVTTNGYRGGVLADNGNIYCAPVASDLSSVLVIEPSGNTIRYITGFPTVSTNQYFGATKGIDGKIYFAPQGNSNLLIVDPTVDPEDISYVAIPGFSGVGQYSDAVSAPNGKIYFIPWNADNVLVYNISSGTFTTITDSFGLSGSNKWSSGVITETGKIYCSPRSSVYILIINSLNDTLSYLINPELVGVFKYYGSSIGFDGNIYFTPFNSNNILKINSRTDNIDFIPVNIVSTDTANWIGSVVDNSGNIIHIPFNNENILVQNIINPLDICGNNVVINGELTVNNDMLINNNLSVSELTSTKFASINYQSPALENNIIIKGGPIQMDLDNIPVQTRINSGIYIGSKVGSTGDEYSLLIGTNSSGGPNSYFNTSVGIFNDISGSLNGTTLMGYNCISRGLGGSVGIGRKVRVTAGCTIVGSMSNGNPLTTGINNTFIGIDAGNNIITGSRNIAFGSFTRFSSDVSNCLSINNQPNSAKGGIYGINLGSDNFKLGINTNTPTETLDISGNLKVNGQLLLFNTDLSGNITTSTANQTAEIKSTTALETNKFIKVKIGGADAWIPYFTSDPSL